MYEKSGPKDLAELQVKLGERLKEKIQEIKKLNRNIGANTCHNKAKEFGSSIFTIQDFTKVDQIKPTVVQEMANSLSDFVEDYLKQTKVMEGSSFGFTDFFHDTLINHFEEVLMKID